MDEELILSEKGCKALNAGSNPASAPINKKEEIKMLSYNSQRNLFYWKGKPLNTTWTEFRILWTFYKNSFRTISRKTLLSEANPFDKVATKDRTIDVHIGRIRIKTHEDLVQSTHKKGYFLNMGLVEAEE